MPRDTEQQPEKTLNLRLHVREVTEEQAEQIGDKVFAAVVGVIGRPPNGMTCSTGPNFEGEPRSAAEEEQAAREGRR